jgi:aldehyde:ferredoxin oxidoreductase
MEAVIKAAHLCDRYGLDTVSTGVTIAWAMEAFERGLLTPEDTGGLDLTWGNAEAVVTLVSRIAHREPGLGDLLADGVKRAAARVGQGSEAFAMQVKGLEFPGYEPRGLQTFALAMAVSTRGGCHNRAPGYEPDMQGKVDRFVAEPGRGALVRDLEDFAAAIDSLTICKFLRKTFADFWGEGAALYRACTGLPMTAADLRRAGERVATLKKVFNIREGWTPVDDWLPARCFDDPLPSGASAGSIVRRDDLRMMIDAYYAARGWTANGLIPDDKLVSLGLGDLVGHGTPRAVEA